MEKSTVWKKIADCTSAIDFNEKGIASIDVEGRKICLLKTPDGLRACTDRCPHAGASLSEGFIDRHQNIVCCVHNYKFNLMTGRDAFNEGYFLKLFEVVENEEGVFVKM